MSNSRSRTPITPFIPPLGSPDATPAPVIPPQSSTTPNYSPHPGGSAYLYPTSPYAHSPFIPPDMSPLTTPGVIPGVTPSTSQSRGPRGGLSEDYTGYPSPYSSPNVQPHPQMTPMTGPYGQIPPGTPWQGPPPPMSAPASYGGFNTTPWGAPASLPSPWMTAGRGPPPPPPFSSPYMPYSPPGFVPGSLPGGQPAWGMQPGMPPPAMQTNYYGGPQGGPPEWMHQQQAAAAAAMQHAGSQGGPPEWMHQQQAAAAAMQHGGFGPPYRMAPEPPAVANDRMPPFAQGPHYGPVLEPMQVYILQAQIRLNPLIQPLPEDGSDQVHLKWSMIHPTSTIQRSSDPPYNSWSDGRDQPATFPRITAVNIISETLPWIITIHASKKDRGVTCGEIIEGIGHELAKFSSAAEYSTLSPQARQEVGNAYRHNRSRNPNVPGGRLGEGMKRLDFLGRHTMFNGIEINDRVVERLHGTVLPCTYLLKCSATLMMTRQEVKDQESRMRASSAQGHRSRSRANSTNTRITVEPPSSADDSDDLAENDHEHYR